MIKGISHNVIEISDTGSDFFERALLFVKPEKGGENHANLEASARGLLRDATFRRKMLRRKGGILRYLGYLLAMAGGVGAAALLFNL